MITNSRTAWSDSSREGKPCSGVELEDPTVSELFSNPRINTINEWTTRLIPSLRYSKSKEAYCYVLIFQRRCLGCQYLRTVHCDFTSQTSSDKCEWTKDPQACKQQKLKPTLRFCVDHMRQYYSWWTTTITTSPSNTESIHHHGR